LDGYFKDVRQSGIEYRTIDDAMHHVKAETKTILSFENNKEKKIWKNALIFFRLTYDLCYFLGDCVLDMLSPEHFRHVNSEE
jgi:hypothetical protein